MSWASAVGRLQLAAAGLDQEMIDVRICIFMASSCTASGLGARSQVGNREFILLAPEKKKKKTVSGNRAKRAQLAEEIICTPFVGIACGRMRGNRNEADHVLDVPYSNNY